jgi:hypothetical protein
MRLSRGHKTTQRLPCFVSSGREDVSIHQAGQLYHCSRKLAGHQGRPPIRPPGRKKAERTTRRSAAQARRPHRELGLWLAELARLREERKRALLKSPFQRPWTQATSGVAMAANATTNPSQLLPLGNRRPLGGGGGSLLRVRNRGPAAGVAIDGRGELVWPSPGPSAAPFSTPSLWAPEVAWGGRPLCGQRALSGALFVVSLAVRCCGQPSASSTWPLRSQIRWTMGSVSVELTATACREPLMRNLETSGVRSFIRQAVPTLCLGTV